MLEALDVRLLRRPRACSWRSLSTCNTTPAVALFLYSRARRTSSSIWLSLLVFFSLALRLCFETLLVSAGALLSSLPALCALPALTSRLCRRSALSALVSFGALPCLCSALVSAVDSAPVSALLPSPLASATPLARRVAFYKRN